MDNDKTIKVLDFGFVQLLDTMPSLPLPVSGREGELDAEVARSARISYGTQDTQERRSTDRALIRYLYRHKHTSPFEMVEFKFMIKCPIFVARQWFRHRTASYNEVSGRYSELKPEYYVPKSPISARMQSTTNKQGSAQSGDVDVDAGRAEMMEEVFSNMLEAQDLIDDQYRTLLQLGLAKELARITLGQNLYTTFIWKLNLHNLLRFLTLRADPTAQYEIQVYADAIIELIKPLIPITWSAFEDYTLKALTLTGPELQCLVDGEQIKNKRENEEWLAKRKKLDGLFLSV